MTDKIQEVSKTLNRLFSSYPQFQVNDEALAAYFEAVDPYLAADVTAAVNAFLTGRVEGFNPSFAPPAPLVGTESRRQMLDRLDREKRSAPRAISLPEPKMTDEEMSKRRDFIGDLAKKYPQFGFGRVSAGFESDD